MRITGKLGNMRKAQDFVVYPPKADGILVVQSDKSIGAFDPTTRRGVLNTKGCYFHHLNWVLGAAPYEFPREFVAAAIEAFPNHGDEIGPGVYMHRGEVTQ